MTLRHRTLQREGREIHYWTGGAVVPGAAHLADQDNPDFFADALLGFLAERGLDSPKG